MFTLLTDTNYKQSIESTEAGLLICFKKLCPHCKNMEKVLEKFSKKNVDVSFFKLDSEENPEAMKELNAERIPTIVVIKKSKIAARKSGLMNPKEMTAFYQNS
jgi:thioredoxin 1